MELLQEVYFGNSVLQWGIALGVAIFALLAFMLVRSLVVRRLRALADRTATDIDDFIVELLGSTRTILILVLAVYAGSYVLEMDDAARKPARYSGHPRLPPASGALGKQDHHIPRAALCAGSGWRRMIRRWRRWRRCWAPSSRIAFFTMVALVALGTIGFDVTPLITGVGIGGIAIAMAVQGILSDLFGSLTIALDKPFEVGDFITVGDFKGTVEKIGLKSTRVRSNTGEQLVLSNGDLLASRMRNFKRMSERRGVILLGVTYQTTADQLAAIPGILQQIIEAAELARFERAHFASFGDFSLNFEVVYWITTPGYLDYMDTTQAINLEIVQRFEAAGIEFAYPTQTLFVDSEGDEQPPAVVG